MSTTATTTTIRISAGTITIRATPQRLREHQRQSQSRLHVAAANRYGGRPVVRGNEGRVYTSDRAPRRGVLDSDATRTREGSSLSFRRKARRRHRVGGTIQGAQQPRRGVPSSALSQSQHREHRARDAGCAGFDDSDSQTGETPVERSSTALPSEPSRRTQSGRQSLVGVPTRQGTSYRSGGGMSQALAATARATTAIKLTRDIRDAFDRNPMCQQRVSSTRAARGRTRPARSGACAERTAIGAAAAQA